MFSLQIVKHFNQIVNSPKICKHQFSTTTAYLAGLRWRIKNGYPENHNSRGVLTDGPDFSYVDGKPTPYTSGQRARILRQQEYANKIVNLLGAINWAKDRYQRVVTDKQKQREYILGKKLKAKGKSWKNSKS